MKNDPVKRDLIAWPKAVGVAMTIGISSWASILAAQPSNTSVTAGTTASGGSVATATVGNTTVAIASEPKQTDHSKMVGRFAIGFMGVNSIPIAQGNWNQAGCGTTETSLACVPAITGRAILSAPTIGARYWLNDRFGIDAGIGFAIVGGTTDKFAHPTDTKNNKIKQELDKESSTAFLLHLGAPIALAASKHFTFEVIPELNIGFSSGSRKDQIPPNPPAQENAPTPKARETISLGGFRLDVGARAGGEVHFGFLGVPELALQATVGLYYSRDSVKASIGDNKATESNNSFGTTVQQAPWAIFTNNIAALYYF